MDIDQYTSLNERSDNILVGNNQGDDEEGAFTGNKTKLIVIQCVDVINSTIEKAKKSV